MPLISISIVSHGQGALVKRLLSSLQRHESSMSLEIILTENLGRVAEGFEAAWSFPVRVVTNTRPQGFASNQNIAFKQASGEYFCILNPDIVFIDPIFTKLIGIIVEGAADILAPIAVDPFGVVQDSFRQVPTPFSLLKRRILPLPSPVIPPGAGIIITDWIAALFMFMRTSTFETIGGMDDRYYLYFEDVDFCSRARLMGFQVGVYGGGRVMHDARRKSRTNMRYFLWHLQSAYRFFSSPTYRAIRIHGERRS